MYLVDTDVVSEIRKRGKANPGVRRFFANAHAKGDALYPKKYDQLANVLLDDLDQHVKHQVRAPHYVRYVDDFILLHDSAQWLKRAQASIESKLAELHLALNPRKTILQPVERGIDFVGHVVKPWRRITRRRTLNLALDRLQDMPATELHQSANSYFGLLRQSSHSHHDRTLVANVLRDRGHVIAGSITKVYRRGA